MNERVKIRRAVWDAFDDNDQILAALTDVEVSHLGEAIVDTVMSQLDFEED